jgi:hypothetical protein
MVRRSSSKLNRNDVKIGKRPLRRGLLTINPFQSTTEWALVANEEKIHGPCSSKKN